MNNKMSVIEILLMPFALIYKGFITILLLPYYFVIGIKKLFSPKSSSNDNKVIAEAKPGESLTVIKGSRSAYSNPVTPEKPVKTAEELSKEKSENISKRQKDFERLVAKARQEEARRAKEQERITTELIARETAEKSKEAAALKKDAAEEAVRKTKTKVVKKQSSIFTKSINIGGLSELELQAKQFALNESLQNQKANATRLSHALVFNYVARNSKGELETSSIEAMSRIDVLSFLKAEGYDVYDISIASANSSVKLVHFKFKQAKLIFYLSQLSAYLKSGIALADAVKILEDQSKNINEKKIWRAVYYDLSMGDILSLAMEKRGYVFPRLLINMIKTAEMTGNLPETLDDMVDYYTESEQTRKQMKSAMMYPTIITCFAAVVVTFILVWVVPQFQDIYEDLGSEMPGITKAIINISNFLKNYLIYIIIIFISIILIFLGLYRNVKSARKAMQEFAMHIPVFGSIIIYNEVTIFTKTFANLINHNVFITDSMEVLGKVTENEIYKNLINETMKNLTKGDPLSTAFKDQWAFPNIAYQMLLTGEKTGRLGPMMERVSKYYEEQHRTIINQMKTLIEPILIVFLALVVGCILIAVIVPMFSMYNEL